MHERMHVGFLKQRMDLFLKRFRFYRCSHNLSNIRSINCVLCRSNRRSSLSTLVCSTQLALTSNEYSLEPNSQQAEAIARADSDPRQKLIDTAEGTGRRSSHSNLCGSGWCRLLPDYFAFMLRSIAATSFCIPSGVVFSNMLA